MAGEWKGRVREGLLVPRGAGGQREEDGRVEVSAGLLLPAGSLAGVVLGDGGLRSLLCRRIE